MNGELHFDAEMSNYVHPVLQHLEKASKNAALCNEMRRFAARKMQNKKNEPL